MRALELGILSVAFTAIASSKRGLNLNTLTVENASVKIYKLGEEIAKLTIKLNIFMLKQEFSINLLYLPSVSYKVGLSLSLCREKYNDTYLYFGFIKLYIIELGGEYSYCFFFFLRL